MKKLGQVRPAKWAKIGQDWSKQGQETHQIGSTVFWNTRNTRKEVPKLSEGFDEKKPIFFSLQFSKKARKTTPPRPNKKNKDLSSQANPPSPCPKGPSVLKMLRRVNAVQGVNSLRRQQNAIDRERREVPVLLGEKGRNTVQIVKNDGGSKILEIRAL